MLWYLFASFVLRLAFGIAATMAATSKTDVTGGFFRVHLWVLLGLNTFACLAVPPIATDWGSVRLWCIAAAVVSYVGAVVWMYEQRVWGQVMIVAVLLLDLFAAVAVSQAASVDTPPTPAWPLVAGDVLTSGILLGSTMTAMLLGHWYLNTPSMKLAPLKRLILIMAAAACARATFSGTGLWGETLRLETIHTGWVGLVTLRWLSGLVGVAVMALMTWQTLKIPNTQSATGILYVAVIFSFIGELSSHLLSSTSIYPL